MANENRWLDKPPDEDQIEEMREILRDGDARPPLTWDELIKRLRTCWMTELNSIDSRQCGPAIDGCGERPRWWKVDDDPLEAHHRATSHQAAREMATGGNAESMCK
ncbi:MAG: hypothetical protein Ct9H90mP1_3060 [Methanobacteriota archaeon]|nr:MAG: hypothetical protein Ct9H90mP1_3060 [Euryarchaeota archaeon]